MQDFYRNIHNNSQHEKPGKDLNPKCKQHFYGPNKTEKVITKKNYINIRRLRNSSCPSCAQVTVSRDLLSQRVYRILYTVQAEI
jgi:hypothetical protein